MADYSDFQDLATRLLSQFGKPTKLTRPIRSDKVDPRTGRLISSNDGVFSNQTMVNDAFTANAVFTNAKRYEYQQGVVQRGDKTIFWDGVEPLIGDKFDQYRVMEVERIAPDDLQPIMYKILVRK